MAFLILAETSAGYALFKAKDKKLLKKDDLAKEMNTAEGASGLFVLPLLRPDYARATMLTIACADSN